MHHNWLSGYKRINTGFKPVTLSVTNQLQIGDITMKMEDLDKTIKFSELDEIIDYVGTKLTNKEIDLVCAIAHVAVMSYKKGYDDAKVRGNENE